MKVLGYVFVLVVILAITGYVRGWFSFVSAASPGQGEVRLTIDRERAAADARAVLDLAGSAAAKGKAAVDTAADTVEGRITSLDATALQVTVASGTATKTYHVPANVPITRDGAVVPFARLQADMRVRLQFDGANLLGVSILP
jgi:hypothetical protein